jgi:hypothetical protein
MEIQPEQSADLLPPESAADRARFALLPLAISIRPAKEEWLERVWVSVSLDLSGDSAPTLWSMVPDRVSSTVSVDDTLTVGANLKFLKAKSERKRSREERLVSVTTFGLMESNGGWELSHVPGEALRGSYEFAAMIRTDETAEIGRRRSIRSDRRSPPLRGYLCQLRYVRRWRCSLLSGGTPMKRSGYQTGAVGRRARIPWPLP